MPVTPPFVLRNVFQALGSAHASPIESTPCDRARSGGARSAQSPSSSDTRIAQWAAAGGQVGSPADFAARLDGAQVAAELLEIFRETPEFGLSMAFRLEPFLDESAEGPLTLFAGGGEAAVLYDEGTQQVVKLLAPPGKARFGWIMERQTNGRWGIRGGSLAEAVVRFAWFEECFSSGLELD